MGQGQLDEYKRFQSISVAFIRASEDLAEARRLALREGNPVKKNAEAFADQVTAAVAADIALLVGKGIFEDGDFEAVERAARAAALQVAGKLVEQYINADLSDMQGPRLACTCGRDASCSGRREKTLTTAL